MRLLLVIVGFFVSGAFAQAQNQYVQVSVRGGAGAQVWMRSRDAHRSDVKAAQLLDADLNPIDRIPASGVALIKLGNDWHWLHAVMPDQQGRPQHGPEVQDRAREAGINTVVMLLPGATSIVTPPIQPPSKQVVTTSTSSSTSSGGLSINLAVVAAWSGGAIGALGLIGFLVWVVKKIGEGKIIIKVPGWPDYLASHQPHLVPEQRLATGGMGTIFVVRRAGGGSVRARRVAVKVLHQQFSESDCPEALRFLDEARVLGRLTPTGLVPRVHTVTPETPRPGVVLWFEMEFLEGWSTLRALIGGRDHRRLPWPDAQLRLRALVQAVGQMHAAGVVHRDLSPENIMVNGDPAAVRLIDFGLARWSGKSFSDSDIRSAHLTQAGEQMGKPRYCAPEQWDEGLAAAREPADWYAVGVMAWEMVTGAPPHDSPEAARTRSLSAEPLEAAGVPSAEARAILALLHPDVSRRGRSI